MPIVNFPTRFFIADSGFLPADNGVPLFYEAANPLLPSDHEWKAPWNFNTTEMDKLMRAVFALDAHTDLITVVNSLQQADNDYDIEISIMRIRSGRGLLSFSSPGISNEDVDPVPSLQISELPYLIAFIRALTENNLAKLRIIQSQEFELSDLEAAIDTSELHSIPGCVS